MENSNSLTAEGIPSRIKSRNIAPLRSAALKIAIPVEIPLKISAMVKIRPKGTEPTKNIIVSGYESLSYFLECTVIL